MTTIWGVWRRGEGHPLDPSQYCQILQIDDVIFGSVPHECTVRSGQPRPVVWRRARACDRHCLPAVAVDRDGVVVDAPSAGSSEEGFLLIANKGAVKRARPVANTGMVKQLRVGVEAQAQGATIGMFL